MPFIEGYAVGLGLIILIGPVLFVLLKSTLEYGKAAGFLVAFGIFVSDIAAVLLCAFGAASFFKNPDNQTWLALGGGALLLGFGLKYLIRPTMSDTKELSLSAGDYLGFFVKGFAVNFINPFVFMVWIGIIGGGADRHGFDADLAWFLAGALLAILTLDSLKVVFADKIKPLLRPKWLRIVFRVSGVLLIAFGLRLVWAGLAG